MVSADFLSLKSNWKYKSLVDIYFIHFYQEQENLDKHEKDFYHKQRRDSGSIYILRQ